MVQTMPCQRSLAGRKLELALCETLRLYKR